MLSLTLIDQDRHFMVVANYQAMVCSSYQTAKLNYAQFPESDISLRSLCNWK